MHAMDKALFSSLFFGPYPADPSFYLYSRKYPDFPDTTPGWYSWTPCYVAERTVWMQLVGMDITAASPGPWRHSPASP